jgi:hypothetical protein
MVYVEEKVRKYAFMVLFAKGTCSSGKQIKQSINRGKVVNIFLMA